MELGIFHVVNIGVNAVKVAHFVCAPIQAHVDDFVHIDFHIEVHLGVHVVAAVAVGLGIQILG